MTEDLLNLVEPKIEDIIKRGRREFATVNELDDALRNIKEEANAKIERTTRNMVNELLAMMSPKIDAALKGSDGFGGGLA